MTKLTIYICSVTEKNPSSTAVAWLIMDKTDVLEADTRAVEERDGMSAEYVATIAALKSAKKFCTPRETEITIFAEEESNIAKPRAENTTHMDTHTTHHAELSALAVTYAAVTHTPVPRENPYIESCKWMCNQTLAHSFAQTNENARKSEPEIRCNPIGYVTSPFRTTTNTPRQNTFAKETSTIHITHEYKDAITGLHEGDYIYVLCWYHLAYRTILKVNPQNNPEKEPKGVFSTRSPSRPNPISLTLVRLEKINNTELTVSGLDALNNTPVLDIKAYFPEIDKP